MFFFNIYFIKKTAAQVAVITLHKTQIFRLQKENTQTHSLGFLFFFPEIFGYCTRSDVLTDNNENWQIEKTPRAPGMPINS